VLRTGTVRVKRHGWLLCLKNGTHIAGEARIQISYKIIQPHYDVLNIELPWVLRWFGRILKRRSCLHQLC